MLCFSNSGISDDAKGDGRVKKLNLILLLFPVVFLLITGCSNQQGLEEKTEENRFWDEKEYLIMSSLTESNHGIY